MVSCRCGLSPLCLGPYESGVNRYELPYAAPGQVVGLFGGSFDPAHEGHVHVTRTALRAFGLDQVWWMVTPGNPLKEDGPAPLEARVARARELMQHPKVEITTIEEKFGTRFTAATLGRLLPLFPRVTFMWVMGADNLAHFHKWQEWREIAAMVPIGVVARPGHGIGGRMSVAARYFREARVHPAAGRLLHRANLPAWCFINAPMRDESSTALRESGAWPKGRN